MTATPYPLPRETRETAILVGNGTPGPYGPTAFKVFDIADVEVWTRAQDAEHWLKSNVTVTKTAAAELDTVSVTFPAAVPATTEFLISSRRLHSREIAVFKGGVLNVAELEKELSKQGSVLEEIRRDLDRGGSIVPGIPGQTLVIGPDGRPLPGADQSQIEAAQENAAQVAADRLIVEEARDVAVAAAGANLANIDSRAVLVLTHMPTVVLYVRTAGYGEPGDGGHALYRRAASEPTHPGKVQSADGAWWELTVSEHSPNPRQFGAKGDGVAVDTAAFTACRDMAVALAVTMKVPGGDFVIDQINLAFARLKIACQKDTILRHTGAGRFLLFDAGTTTDDYLYEIHLTGYPTLQGNADTTDLVYIRSSHHMLLDIRPRDCDVAVRADFTVLSRMNILHSANQEPWAVKQPVNTIILDRRIRDANPGLGLPAATEPSTANTVVLISEGVSGAGVLLPYAQVNNFYGTSEGNGIGVDIQAPSTGNKFHDGFFMEANSIVDISDGSAYTMYDNIYAGSASGSLIASFKSIFKSGYVRNLTIDVTAGKTRLTDTNLTGVFTDNSISTIREDCHNLGTPIADRPHGAWRAHKGSGDQGSIPDGAWTKITCGSEVFDSLNVYNPATSSVTPRAGVHEHRFTASIIGGVAAGGLYGAAIYKNGARIAEDMRHASASQQITVSVECTDYTDGSGTYEYYLFGNGGGSKTVSGNVAATWVEGRYVRDLP